MSNNQNQNRTANDEWVYHNRDRLSPAQLDELRQKDDKLESRLAELEKKGVQRDPNFKHPVVDENNPPRPAEPFRAAPPSGSSFWYWVVGLSGLGLLVYFVGFRRYRSLA